MRKKTHEEVAQAIAARGHRLISEFKDISTHLDILCPNGHEYKMNWRHFNGGRRCGACIIEEEKAQSLAMVQNAFSKAGYTLLAERYDRNSTRMACICNNGHQIKMDWASFQYGIRCIECSNATRGKTKKLNTGLRAKAKFEAEGYQLLDEYTDAHTLMRFICPEGHEHQMSWTNFDSGYRCAYCSKTNVPVDPEDVRKTFEAEGYKLLDTYTNSKKRLRFICPQGHKYSIAWENFRIGKRCAICSGSVLTRKSVKNAFNEIGYTLLSKYNNDNTEKLDFICDQGHRHKINWSSFKSGCRCAQCNKPSVDPNLVEQTFLAAGYTPLARYQGTDIKIPYICPEGHQHSVAWYSFKSGNRCPECQGKIVKHEDVEAAFAAEGYELLDTYKNSTTRLRYICPEGHQHSIAWSAFKQGHRCAYCAGQILSEEQKEINAIKHRVGRLIQIYLKRQEAQKPFSISGFSGVISKSIYEKLGNKPDGYHLDHIVPQAFFDFRIQEEIETCWHIDNLRYIPAIENVTKGHRLRIEDVENFTESQLKILAKASRKPSIFDAFLKKKGIEVSQQTDKPIAPKQLSFNF